MLRKQVFHLTMACDLDQWHTDLGYITCTSFVMVDTCAKQLDNWWKDVKVMHGETDFHLTRDCNFVRYFVSILVLKSS